MVEKKNYTSINPIPNNSLTSNERFFVCFFIFRAKKIVIGKICNEFRNEGECHEKISFSAISTGKKINCYLGSLIIKGNTSFNFLFNNNHFIIQFIKNYKEFLCSISLC